MSERYIKASDVKKMISTNSAMKRYFPWAENMFLNLIDDLPGIEIEVDDDGNPMESSG